MFFSFVLTVVSWSLTAKHNRKEEGKEKCHLSQHDQKKKKKKQNLQTNFPVSILSILWKFRETLLKLKIIQIYTSVLLQVT